MNGPTNKKMVTRLAKIRQGHSGADAFGTELGMYVHVPFCASTCDFCAFYQIKPQKNNIDHYLSAIKNEVALIIREQGALDVTTMFWGGGTPGLLKASDLEILGSSVLSAMNRAPGEWTVEMAPSVVKEDKLRVLKDLGVTRISMGVQSFNPVLLENLGRMHNPHQIYSAWECIQKVGFAQTNLDFIFAIPGQSFEDWRIDLQQAAQLNPSHISTYCLTFEEDTSLYIKLSQGKLKIDKEQEAQFYEKTWACLEEMGFYQYEISNFSKPGCECVHNINTWKMQEWVGLGPAAASQFGGYRYKNPSSLQRWADAVNEGRFCHEEKEALTPQLLATDALIFGLRMNAGVSLSQIASRFPSVNLDHWNDLWVSLQANELMVFSQDRIALTNQGRLVADQVAGSILAVDC
jgi:oxygen-independent coproporphyrinogen III oxidase